ncbi:PqiC family protein [Pseudoalteromonas pernae]|uniref:PqiC family protein n=1 Tax=Pseudoalteromonas pernae TaxID=3118054 RepID=UPI003242F8D2
MFRFATPIIAIALASACSSSGSPSDLRYYQFNNNQTDISSVSQVREQTQYLLRLSPIKVHGTLNNRAMVIKLSEHEIYSANSHFWADAPAQMLVSYTQTQLMRQLNNVLVVKGADVYAEQLESAFFQLDIDVEQFNAGLDNNAEIAGLWRLSKVDNKGKLHVLKIARFAHTEPLADDGYGELAKALEGAWKNSISEMSTDINTLIAKENMAN